MIKICPKCNKEFYKPKCLERIIHCSVKCKNKSPVFSAIMSKSRLGIKFSSEHLKNLSKSHIGIQKGNHNGMWKGDKVGYIAIHGWVKRWLGKPNHCEHCGNNKLGSRQYHWANKSGKYLRELSDWLRLCVPCHKKYDLKMNDKKKKKKFKINFHRYTEDDFANL